MVDADIGHFSVTLKKVINNESTWEELAVIPCSDSEFVDIAKYKIKLGDKFNALYCLKDYRSYMMRPDFGSSLDIKFEACNDRPTCKNPLAIDPYLKGKQFWFPFEQPNIESVIDDLQSALRINYSIQDDHFVAPYI